MSLQYPLLQPVLPFAERQIPVLGRLLHQAVARVVLVGWVDKLVWREGGSTFLTLVAIGSLCSASWTGAHDVAVGEELSCHLVAELVFGLLLQLALVVECAEEV